MKAIDIITHTTDTSRATLFRRFANLPIENQLQVLKSSQNYQFKNADKLKEYSNAQKNYISIVISISHYSDNKFDRLNIEEQKKKLTKQEKIKVQRIKNKFAKKSKVKDKLLSKRYWLVVEKLRIVDKMSFRAISNFLLTYHKFKVDYTYIAKTWKEVTDVQ